MTEITKEMIEAAKAAYWHEAHNGGGYSDKCYEAAISAALSSRSAEAGKPVVKGLDDSALVKLMYKHLPPKVADDLTIDKHPPMFPQAEYSVPTLSARNFVDALFSALSTPADIETVSVPGHVRDFLGKVQGVCMGVAMSGRDHPNPDGVLVELFNEAQEILFPAAAPQTNPSTVDAEAVIERLTNALRSADEWMSCVDGHLQSGEPFRRDREAIRSALAALAKSPNSDRAASELATMRDMLIKMHVEGVLSEGQVAKATGFHRIAIRKMADELNNGAA
ncbi:hypothetical protein [Ensifer canadensis]